MLALAHTSTSSSYSAAGLADALGPQAGTEIVDALILRDAYVASINVTTPWNHPYASVLDAMTLQFWANETFASDTVNTVLNLSIPAIFSAEAGELSFLYTLAYIAAAGNATTPGAFECLISTASDSQESRILGGTGLLAEGLAKRIGLQHVKLNTPVLSITQRSTDDYLISSDTSTFESLTGQAVSSTGYVRTTFDVSPEDASYGPILGFIEADQMRALDSATGGKRKSSSRKTLYGTSVLRRRARRSGSSSDGLTRSSLVVAQWLLQGPER
ncbi:hypothetical protein LTR78_009159 [Recurvomyces mirabilis]|uniref:Uncharacterized protein n=1 Tax=Recurvomyces mirabilis TaxID=574656 RepID=A0AAE0WFF8_9PEZI|nr:hypothetical protein LTR78_009159 [Recurvomyces mirabilis]KAK5155681.1 hypothetical protein LTS14_005942 [Recurvomyces mirabilis]